MIEWIIGGAVALALLTRKKGPSGPGSGSDDFFAEDGFSPDPANPTKVEKGFDIANKTLAVAASAVTAAIKAAAEYRNNPTPENKKKLTLATATANRARAAAARVKKQKPPKGAPKQPAKDRRAAKGQAKQAAKAAANPKGDILQKGPSEKEKQVIAGALRIMDGKGIPDSEKEKIARLPEKEARAVLAQKGLTKNEIKIVITAIKVRKKMS